MSLWVLFDHYDANMNDGTFLMVEKSVPWCFIMLYRVPNTQVLYSECNIDLKVQSVVRHLLYLPALSPKPGFTFDSLPTLLSEVRPVLA